MSLHLKHDCVQRALDFTCLSVENGEGEDGVLGVAELVLDLELGVEPAAYGVVGAG